MVHILATLTYTIHILQQMCIHLLPIGSHAHLAEPGSLHTKQRHCEPCKQSSWSWARNLQKNRPFLIASGVGTQPVHLEHCCFMRKGLEFASPANARSPITARWTGGAGGR